MAFAKATVESRANNPCADWTMGGGKGDVKKGLYCDTSEQQLWLVFYIFLTANCVGSRFFGTLLNALVSVIAEITFVVWWTLFIWKLKLEKAWKNATDLIVCCIILLASLGTYKNSLWLGRDEAIFEQCNPAFGGRGPGFHRTVKGSKPRPQFVFDSTCGFHGEGWSNRFPLMKMATWNCRSLTFERVQYCRSLGFDVLALTELWHNQKNFNQKTNHS